MGNLHEITKRLFVVTPSTADDLTAFGKQEFGLLDIVHIFLSQKRVVLGCALVFAVVATLVVFLVRPTFTARATFLPPPQPTSGSAMLLGQLAALGGGGSSSMGALSSMGGLKDPSLVYIGILESRTVADDLIHQFDLQKIYKAKKLSKAEKALAKHTNFIPGKDTLVTVTVEDHDPKRACAMANAYLAQLQQLNNRLALTDAAQRRVFFEQQLQDEKNHLADAEVDLARTQEQTGLIRPTGQAELQIVTIAQTRAAIASREIELSSLNRAATEENPEVIRLRSEIAGLQAQLSKLENSNQQSKPGNIQVPTARVPELTLLYVRKEREVKYHEALYEMLMRQLEAAKLDEGRSAPLIQIVDYAVVPDSRSWPPRTLLVIIAVVVGLIIGVIFALSREALARARSNAATATKLDSIRAAALGSKATRSF